MLSFIFRKGAKLLTLPKPDLCETRFLEVDDLQSEVSPQAFLVKLDLPSQPVHLDQLHVVDLKKANKNTDKTDLKI